MGDANGVLSVPYYLGMREPMAEAIWYYAQDDREHGPVTGAYIAGMARTGKLRPEDLVWREGMEDWRPARVVKGLFPAPAEKPASSASDTAVLEAPWDAPPPVEDHAAHEDGAYETHDHGATTVTSPPEPAPPPVAPAPARFRDEESPSFDAEPPRASEETPAPMTVDAARAERGASESRSPMLVAAWGAFATGLILALLARGCDALGSHYVLRLAASAESPTGAPRGGQADDAAEPSLDSEATGAANSEAREALRSYRVWSFWRQVVFLAGVLATTTGAFGLAMRGARAEQWLGVISLAIVLLSLFFGDAWAPFGGSGIL